MISRGQIHWFQKKVWFYLSLQENEPNYNLIYNLIEQSPNEFLVSVASRLLLTRHAPWHVSQILSQIHPGYPSKLCPLA